MNTRDLSVHDAATLEPGSDHYRAWVGPPNRYDLIASGQFALLHLLGLRDTHKVLDFGCGSLRLGRLLIPFLRPNGYFGIEPNPWLIDEGFARELGHDARALKSPRFDHNAQFRCDVFDGARFDFVVAQSILTHTGADTSVRLLQAFAEVLKPRGLAVLNWMLSPADDAEAQRVDWNYPACTYYTPELIEQLYSRSGLAFRSAPWPHPAGLRWDVAAACEEDLPSLAELQPLAMSPLLHPAS